MLKMAIKLATDLKKSQKNDLYSKILIIDRDFRKNRYSAEIKLIVFDCPLAFIYLDSLKPYSLVLFSTGLILDLF